MIAGTPILGLFALACTLQDVDPFTGSAVAELHHASLVARDGIGAFTGWSEIEGQDQVSVRTMPDQTVIMSGLKFRNSSDETWAVLIPNPTRTGFDMEWFLYGHIAVDGRRSVAVWSKGNCETLGK